MLDLQDHRELDVSITKIQHAFDGEPPGDLYRGDTTGVVEGALLEFLRDLSGYTTTGHKIHSGLPGSPSSSAAYVQNYQGGGFVYSSVVAGATDWGAVDFAPRHDYAQEAGAADWIDRAIALFWQNDEEGALHEISLRTTELKDQGDVEAIATSISRADLGKMPAIILIAVLRNAFSVRRNIPNWSDLLDKASRTLREQGRDPHITLRGLR